jgi:hypothetical protein
LIAKRKIKHALVQRVEASQGNESARKLRRLTNP